MGNEQTNILKDAELMILIQKKNRDAFQELFNRYHHAIFNYIHKYCGNREMAQDLLQETFTRVWFSAHLFTPDRGQVKNWMFTIARNNTRNAFARKVHATRFEDIQDHKESPQLSVPQTEQPDAAAEKTDIKKRVTRAMAKLKPELRDIVLLKHYQQLKFREIAVITGIAEGTLKARFQKALTELKDLLGTMEL